MAMDLKLSQLHQNGHANNFNLIRILAALSVVVSHAYPLALGKDTAEPLSSFLPMYNLGRVGVWTFFIISGFFISQSFERHKFWEFAAARILRIYPGLLTVLLITAFVAGPLFTEQSLHSYFTNSVPYKYILNCLSLKFMAYNLPGVFMHNPFPENVNGALWTLFYETLCYGIVVVFGFVSLKIRGGVPLLLLYLGIQIYVTHLNQIDPGFYAGHKFVRTMHEMTYPFILGMIYYHCRNAIPYHGAFAILAAIAIFSLQKAPHFDQVFILLWSYIVMYAGYYQSKFLQRYNRIGDYSYGVYIYGWLIEQMVAAEIHPITPASMMFVSIFVTLLFAIASWHFIEKPCLRLKFLFKTRPLPNPALIT